MLLVLLECMDRLDRKDRQDPLEILDLHIPVRQELVVRDFKDFRAIRDILEQMEFQVPRETLDTQEQPAFKEKDRPSEQRDKLRAALDQKVQLEQLEGQERQVIRAIRVPLDR